MDGSAQLKAMREMAGHSQQSLADALGVHVRTVSRWERGALQVPDDAFEFLDCALARQQALVEAALGKVDGATSVQLGYARSQADFEAAHPYDGGYYGEANAAARQVAYQLMVRMVPHTFVYSEPAAIASYEREFLDFGEVDHG